MISTARMHMYILQPALFSSIHMVPASPMHHIQTGHLMLLQPCVVDCSKGAHKIVVLGCFTLTDT